MMYTQNIAVLASCFFQLIEKHLHKWLMLSTSFNGFNRCLWDEVPFLSAILFMIMFIGTTLIIKREPLFLTR